MFARFQNAYDTSPELVTGTVYWLEFKNIGNNGVIHVTMPQSDLKKNKPWRGIYGDYKQFLEDWELV